MMSESTPIDKLIHELKERAKELNCLYEIQELLSASDITIDELCKGIIHALPPGWQYPDVCQAKIRLGENMYYSNGFQESLWVQSSDIVVQNESIGKISVYYTEERPQSDEGPFLKEERKLINTIAEQLGFYILHQQLKSVFTQQQKTEGERKREWGVILDLLKRTDPGLLMRITSKMINFLYWNGVQEAERLLNFFGPASREAGIQIQGENRPNQPGSGNVLAISDEVFATAGQYFSQETILENIQSWIKQDRSAFLVDVLANPGSSLADISSAIERYHLLSPQGIDLAPPRAHWFRTALIRRVLSDNPEFIHIAKNYVTIDDFYGFIRRVIFPSDSHGKLGGKSSGLFIASQVLKQSSFNHEILRNIQTPKTWYLTSDAVFYFMTHNNLEDFIEQKYKDLGQVRQEYPYIVHVFKNSPLPPEIIKGLSLALEDFGEVPLIVRSSSLLEDQNGVSFAGKYKSLFIANQGTKEDRLISLMDAIVEVYASMFAPDPLEYRYNQKLVDNHEEMGIMIQEVVGKRVGDYFLPAFAGVAFSNNDFRWSSRIKREDGLVRMVPGLGTRAVDRLSDDYPVLVSPGQPNLRVNVSLDEVVRYSPRKVDLINMKTCQFDTVELSTLFKNFGNEYPMIHQIVSVLGEDSLRLSNAVGLDFTNQEYVVTFEGLVTRTRFIEQIRTILTVLKEAFGYPVDIEFAHDGSDFYLLQCRAQSYRGDSLPAEIPENIPVDKILFTANRFISNGIVRDLTYLVNVDPYQYSELNTLQDLQAVGRAVSRLNQVLPRRQFLLIGPGRWGSRGDIKLGVSVTYSDINNTAMLIEVARQQKNYLPEPSFGTHFFQDLVETSIAYLPLYPDDPGIIFNENYWKGKKNLLAKILPDMAYLDQVIQVVDIKTESDGLVLHVRMNAEKQKAVAFLAEPSEVLELEIRKTRAPFGSEPSDTHWRWRLQAAETIASHLDGERFGVQGFYVFGSANNASAGPESDIDLLVHFIGTDGQRKDLLTWLDGWSLSLDQENYLRTGYKIKGILDIHIITDEDLKERTSFAIKIGAIDDPARPLAMGTDIRRN